MSAALALPGFAFGKTYAPSPVWRDSVRGEVKFVPLAAEEALSRKLAARIFRKIRRFEGQTRQRGKQDGVLGRNGVAVAQVLLFDHLNHRTGRLDPSYETIARAANISVRSVARGLQKLKAARVLTWIRRCTMEIIGGRAVLSQDTNAYAMRPTTHWAGFWEPPPPPPPDPGTCGEHPPMAAGLDAAAEELREGCSLGALQRALEADPGDRLSAQLAGLQRRLF